jgi:exosortase/archaeosortase family protein
MSLMITGEQLWTNYQIFLYKIPYLLLLFGTIIAYFLVRHKFERLGKIRKWNFINSMWFLGVNVLIFVLFLFLNFYIMETPDVSYSLLLFFWYLLAAGMTITLAFTFFSPKNIVKFVKSFYIEILASAVLAWLFLNFYSMFQKLWPIFSLIVGKSVYFFLSLFYSDAIYEPSTVSFGHVFEGIPTVGTPDFLGAVFEQCSGIESLSLFLLFFTIIVIIEWKEINKRKLLILYPLGLGLMFLVNIARITLLLIAAREISPAFAAGGFHSNFGWILFAIFFVIFEFFSYKWMKN